MTDNKPPSSPSSGIRLPPSDAVESSPAPSAPVKTEAISVDLNQDEIRLYKDDLDPTRVAKAKVRYEEDLKKHHYEPPAATRIQDDWQVAYVWAFIVKFQQLERIRKLECLEDFEHSLQQPVALRPDDIYEGILIRFLSNLKPGLKSVNCTNIQSKLSEYIKEQLTNSTEFTVWDRPWAPNEEPRGPCCNDSEERTELGRLRYPGEPNEERVKRNPILQAEAKGGGLFEMDWKDRAKMLRQLVDWQLTHAESIRGIIGKEYKLNDNHTKKVAGLDTSIITLPLGQDRDKARVWSLDDSGRLYKSGNPFKRPCPLITISTSRAELNALQEQYKLHGEQSVVKPKGSGPKGKLTPAEGRAFVKFSKGVEDERKLAAKIEELAPAIEKEEQRVLRQRRKIAAAAQLAQQAEFRSSRTRRSTKKIDYTYGDESEFEEPSNKRSRAEEPTWEGSSTRGRVMIPGERRSARVTALQQQDERSEDGSVASVASNRIKETVDTPLQSEIASTRSRSTSPTNADSPVHEAEAQNPSNGNGANGHYAEAIEVD